ncbi:uncharacterized protein K489DRAFT_373869 [Dissoconium aciculare CBS 342.82]|uniref:Uncharacterized protein n=1 Tax=Dissoconium aciculare CBS 342.82 TaxID=1314786 RepID=A0A6J3LW58_9PEZI|nr:uncharacterized protein K489DRAFT_373869 [Dissoconium aciculare CBS 342.82]KAF1818867.1 hypothetical protein K489DRAFT_373869 [Dissoconium aciculare CBS 342.82]
MTVGNKSEIGNHLAAGATVRTVVVSTRASDATFLLEMFPVLDRTGDGSDRTAGCSSTPSRITMNACMPGVPCAFEIATTIRNGKLVLVDERPSLSRTRLESFPRAPGLLRLTIRGMVRNATTRQTGRNLHDDDHDDGNDDDNHDAGRNLNEVCERSR